MGRPPLGLVAVATACLLIAGCKTTMSPDAVPPGAATLDPGTEAAVVEVLAAQESRTASPGPAPSPAAGRSNADIITLTVPNRAHAPNTYQWRGQTYTGSEAFLAAVSARVAEQVASVERGAAVGSARVLLPPHAVPLPASKSNPAGAADGLRTVERAMRLLDEGRVTALQRSGLFEPVRSEPGATVLPAAGGTDFVLWFDNAAWHLRYRDGDPQSTGNVQEYGNWLRAVRTAAKTAQAGGGKPTLTLSMSFRPASPNGVLFTFKGATYETAEALNPVVRAAFLEEARGVQPIANRLGGRLKVVVLTSHVGIQIAMQGNPRANETIRSAFSNNTEAIALGRVEALRQSHLFDEVVMETADLKDVPLAGFDYVLWEPVGTPLAWHYRSSRKGGDNSALVSPGPHSTLQQWLEAVRDQLGNRAAGS